MTLLSDSAIVRAAIAGDRSYIAQSYLSNHRRTHPVKFIPGRIYFRGQAKVLDWLMAHAAASVACFAEAPDEILGYCLYQPTPAALIIHYIYVRECYRKRGIGRLLMSSMPTESAMIVCSHVPDDFVRLRRKLAPHRIVYDPYTLLGAT